MPVAHAHPVCEGVIMRSLSLTLPASLLLLASGAGTQA